MIDIDTSSVDELKAEFARLAAVVASAEDERKQIWAEIEKRTNDSALIAVVRDLDDRQRAALKEML